MSNTFLLSIVCPDRPGLISAVTAELFDLGINLGDTSFAVLGEGAEFSAVLQAPASLDAAAINDGLQALPGLGGADIRIKPFMFGTHRQERGNVTHEVLLQGDDQPGLVARLTELLLDYDANIVRMDTRVLDRRDHADYEIELDVWIPQARGEACIAAIHNTAASLGMSCQARCV